MRATTLAGLILAVCALTNSALAQSQSDRMIASSQRAHDFGTVARAAKTEHRFEIKNPYQQPMHLRSISASCGCTTPIIETEWIKPGEVGYVLARFNTGTFTGDRKATLNLMIDQPSSMMLQLNVKGYIRSDIVINPGQLNFGTVAQGESKQIEANIEYAGRSDWKLTGISNNDQFIDAKLTETSRSGGRVGYKITATLAPDAQPGPQATEMILHTNDARLKTVPLSCFAQIDAPLSVSPNNVALGEMKLGQPVKQRLLIKGASPFQVLDVTVPDMQVSFEPTDEPKAMQFLNLTLMSDNRLRSGDIRTQMTIKTDMDGEHEVTLDLSYRLKAAPSDSGESAVELSNNVSSRARRTIAK